ncbi:MAG: type I polyketide synthase [Bacteroidota bacterium]
MSTIAGNTSDNQKLLAEALISIKRTQQKLQLLEAEKSEPIAIVSASCRLPGQVNDLESFRQFLSAGQDGITDLPADRWDMEHYYTDDRTTAGKMCVRRAGVIENTDCFDAGFFRISPKEAEKMDPQQRLLLELAWESLEKANIIPESLYNQSVGVFIGISTSDYLNLLIRRIDESEINGYVATGNSFSTAAGRISYYLGLKGPCIALDTACSSSLTAIHLACESLRKKECNYALAGGVNLLLEPLTTTAFSQAGMLSPDGSCKTFDASANGYVRSEGGGMVVLKRLTDAIADGDQILAKILGSATNHNGPSGGLTVPNGTAQQALIQQALKNAKIDSGDVSYVEAHGTGTSLGDPIEINALQQVFSKSHGEGESLLVGSVKTNIGHLEAAAGIAGMLKLICQLQSREIYPHLHLSTPNPYILWDTLALKIPTKKAFWKANGKKRIGGVSSFGVNGSNAHVILEEYLPTQEKQPFVCHIDDEHPAIIPISAKNKERLQAYVRRLLDFVQATDKAHEPGFLANLAYTCQTGREAMEERVTFRVHHISELQEVLEQYLVGEENIPGCYQGRVKKERELVVEEKGVDTLAERWVNGEAVDWNLLHTTQKPNKISLPTYPFARERYWALLTNMASGNANTAQANLHPLVHVNVSDLAAQAYRSVFTGEESFLKDHRVRGKKSCRVLATWKWPWRPVEGLLDWR